MTTDASIIGHITLPYGIYRHFIVLCRAFSAPAQRAILSEALSRNAMLQHHAILYDAEGAGQVPTRNSRFEAISMTVVDFLEDMGGSQ